MIPQRWSHHPYARVFVLTLLITAIARGAAFLPAYAIDDYGLTLRDSLDAGSALRAGRFGQAALVPILHGLQLEPQYARVFFVAFALIASAFLATVMVRHWNLRPSGWLPVAAAASIAIHPFAAELFTFRTALGMCTFAFAMLALLLVPRRWSFARVLAGSALFALTLSTYQIVLHYAVMLVLMTVAIGLTRQLVASDAGTSADSTGRIFSWPGLLGNRNCALFACVALGTAGYMLVGPLVARMLRFPPGARTALLAPAEVGARWGGVVQVLRSRFVEPDAFLNGWAKGLLGLLLLGALLGLVARTLRQPRWRKAALLPAVLGLIAIAAVWTVGVLLVLAEFWPVARVMAHAGVFWAGILIIAHRCLGRRLRPALGVLSLLILLSFVGSGNRVLHDQIRLNARDAAKASRIIERLEALPGFTGREAVVVLGRDWRYPHGYPTLDHDMNISAFGAPWAKVEILREISGYRFQKVPAAQLPALDAYCAKVLPWPGPESVAVQDGAVVVCLEND